MTDGASQNQDIHSQMRTALVAFTFMAIEYERKNVDLEQVVREKVGPEAKRSLEARAEDMLRLYRNEFLTTGIIEAIGQKIRESLQESKWVKWTLMATQVFGFGAATTLLAQYEKLQLTPSARYALTVYIGCLLVALVLGILGFRSKDS